MKRLKVISVSITEWQADHLKRIKERVGIPQAVLIRNAITAYLQDYWNVDDESHQETEQHERSQTN